MMCYHCKKRDNPETDHDHFLTCPFSETRKDERIATFIKILLSLKTSDSLIKIITSEMKSFYDK